MKSKSKKYIFIVLDNDEAPYVINLTKEQIKDTIKLNNLTKWDYAIIDGAMIKSFDNGSFDIEKLK